MKVLLAAHHTPPTYNGGVEWVTLHGARWLQNNGHEVEIVSVEQIQPGLKQAASRQDVFQGIKIHRLSIPASPETRRFEESGWNEAVAQWFSNFFDNHHPDVFHLHSGYLLTLSPLQSAIDHGIPSVLSLHDYWTVCPRINLLHPNGERCKGPEPGRCAWCIMTEKRRYRWMENLQKSMVRQAVQTPIISRVIGKEHVSSQVRQRQARNNEILNKVDVILALGSLTRDLVVQQGIPPEKVILATNGLDTSNWPNPLPEKIPSDKFRIGYLGNITPLKGVHILVKAFRELSEARKPLELLIYGDLTKISAYGSELKWLAGGDERIRFMGRYENQTVPRILQEVDVLVVPSLWNEVCPLVVLEGFACQTPLVVSDLASMNTMVTNGVDGLIFNSGDVNSLRNALFTLIEEPGLLAHLTYGIKPIKSHDAQMQEWLQAYQSAGGGVL